jgi:hypothetical protein
MGARAKRRYDAGMPSLDKIVAVFRQPEAAESAREQVKSAAGLDDRQVRIVGPRVAPLADDGSDAGASAERAALRAHFISAFGGLLLGTIAWAALEIAGIDVVASTPVPSLVALTLLGATLGFLLGGADRQGREPSAPRLGRWALVVQPLSLAQLESALATLRATGAPVACTP